EPVEGEARPAEIAHALLQPERRVEYPAPRRAGHHEGHRHRVEIDRPQRPLADDAAIEQDGEQQPDGDAEPNVEGAEDEEVAIGDQPARIAPQPLILDEPGKVVVRQQGRSGERDPARPQGEAVEEDRGDRDGRREDQPRHPEIAARAHGQRLPATASASALAPSSGVMSRAKKSDTASVIAPASAAPMPMLEPIAGRRSAESRIVAIALRAQASNRSGATSLRAGTDPLARLKSCCTAGSIATLAIKSWPWRCAASAIFGTASASAATT